MFDFDSMIRRAFPKAGEIIKAKIKSNLATVSHGHTEVYKGRTRWVSRRGDAPNNRSFDLTQSVRYKLEGTQLVVGEGDDRINYARFLESSRDLNRQNIKPSIVATKEKIDSVIEDALKDALRR